MKNKTMTCVLLSEEGYKEEKDIIDEVEPHDYHENSAKITSDGIKTYCKMQMIVDSIEKHLEDKTLSFSKKEIVLNSDKSESGIKYTFVDKKNKLNIVVLVPEEFVSMQYDPYPKYSFIKPTIKSLNNLNQKTNKIRNLRIKRRVVAAILALATFGSSYTITTKIVNKKTKKENESINYTDYDRYYRGIISEEQYNENANRLQKTADKVLKK